MTSKPLTFQQVILRLQEFWADQGCLIWQPYSEKVGAGTMNPGTVLRVLGPEPWNVAYVEPSYRPDDGRYGENPNRMQLHYQFQVILKPDPGDPQERFLESLFALGIRREEHDIRFVEDNWESPALGAWGLGWEVWLDGLEITQFTYFQQAGGFVLDPVSVEITYGLERIVMFLQGVRSVWEIQWDDTHTYGGILLNSEIEHCRYDFEVADVERLVQMYNLFEAEARNCLSAGLVIPAHDYVLRCSHTFNLLDARGAIGVTERATYFRRMRDLSRQVAEAYVSQVSSKLPEGVSASTRKPSHPVALESAKPISEPRTFVLEIGTEELPANDLDTALAQLAECVPTRLQEARLSYTQLRVLGTPRRLIVLVDGLMPGQQASEQVIKGPPVHAAFDASGRPTAAAEGFARKHGLKPEALEVREIEGNPYVVAVKRDAGRPTPEVLAELLPDLIGSLRFQKSMRWNQTNVAFSRPLRWYVALFGDQVVPFEYAGVVSGRASRSSRAENSSPLVIPSAEEYLQVLAEHHIVAAPDERKQQIAQQAATLAASVGGRVPDDPDLLREVANLVEWPTAFLGHFEEQYLHLPAEVLIAVMRKHQRYFPVVRTENGRDRLLPYFVAVRNGGEEYLNVVRAGNEEVLRARFADAEFFYREDTQRPLEAFVPALATLTFQEHLGSMLEKTQRIERLVEWLAPRLDLSTEDTVLLKRAAHLCKADLVTHMVIELTSLQGVMGQHYALRSGERPEVARALFEQYLPRFAGDRLPETRIGLALGLANRLDSLAGLFAVGLVPTGSSDPYQLRRDALGMVQCLIAHRVSFPVRAGLEAAGQLLPVTFSSDALEAALEFVIDRLRGYLREQGFSFSVVEAVLAARGDDPYRALLAVEQLSRWVKRPDWNTILDNYARCVRITRHLTERLPLNPERFVQPAEHELFAAYQQARAQIKPESSVDEFLTAFLPLVPIIERYFAKESGVMVMAEEPELRENRLAQCQHIAALAEGIVDLSRLEGF